MSQILTSTAAFVIAIGVLIAFHEFGHFWVARRAGVKVLRFSIGFGKPLWTKRRGPDQTEFVLAAIPLGGYVKMLDEREGEVAKEELHRAFNRQSVGKRAAIVVAGPVFNFIFAVVAYFIMYLVGVPGVKPITGEITENSAAARATIHSGDQILSVMGEPTPTWSNVRIKMLQASLDSDRIDLEVQDATQLKRLVTLDVSTLSAEMKQGDMLQYVGLTPFRPVFPAIVGELEKDGAALRDGMQRGDQVLSVDNHPIASWQEWVDVIKNSPDKTLNVEVRRGEASVSIALTPKAMETDSGVIGRIGALPKPVPYPKELLALVQLGPLAALSEAISNTWGMSILTLRMIGKMLIGEVSLKNLSGPLTIATYAGYTASEGVSTFLSFLAIVSISLGVLNLLPIPLLDGGHLLVYTIEAVKGSAISEETQIRMQQVGILLLGMLMVLAFYNDIQRLL